MQPFSNLRARLAQGIRADMFAQSSPGVTATPTPRGGVFLLRLESTTVVCFDGVTRNPVSPCVAIRSVGSGPGGNQDDAPPRGVFLYLLESTTVLCFDGDTAIPVCVCVPGRFWKLEA
jgi:hypothetical protein